MNSVNFNKLPINRPLVPVHNNQRDGYMQPNVFKGKVAYFPNSAQGNTPSVVSRADGGYLEYPERINANKQRGKGQKFSDHYSQATLFWNSLTTAEQQQTVDNARFEIGKCTNATIRSNMVQVLNHVDNNFAVRVAFGVGVDAPEPVVDNHNQTSIGLSIENYPRPNHIRAKRVAILTAPGIYTAQAQSMYDYLLEEGAYPDFIGFKLGDQDGLNITQTYVTISPVLYDAVYVPSGDKSAFKLLADNLSAFPYEEPIAFILDTYRHGKPIAVSARGQTLLKLAKLPASALYGNTKSETTYGVFIDRNGNYLNDLSKKFRQGIIKQRYWARLALDPNAKESLTPSNISIVDDLENMFK
jgi:catalase